MPGNWGVTQLVRAHQGKRGFHSIELELVGDAEAVPKNTRVLVEIWVLGIYGVLCHCQALQNAEKMPIHSAGI